MLKLRCKTNKEIDNTRIREKKCCECRSSYFYLVKNRWSLLAVFVVALTMLIFRFSYPTNSEEQLKVTTFDAFGYYMYNPSIFIYGDVTELKWVPAIEEEYHVTGGEFYQASQQENGKYTNKYLGGVAVMQLPFFLGAHAYASITDHPSDGFSAPYQYSIALGAIIYCFLGMLLLRNVLMRFFRDGPVAVTLLLLGLGTNLIQYTSIDSAQSHAYIFPLYALILWATIKWHDSPNWKWAALIGFTIGLATICRPTELIMIFIPLLWNTHEKIARKEKWQLVRKHLPHLAWTIGFGLIGVLPQLIYWKYTTGSFVYDVGSKWFFFNPWFRVLFGVNNGFFIYTPLTILFIVGFFYLKKYPFKRSVLTFCLLNIWIIIAWSDWRYGATYSTRAMVQSYPVFALAMGAAVTYLWERKILKLLLINLGIFFIYANIFQIIQYNSSVLHYHDMNWKYYSHVYLNPNPTPLDFSLLDTDTFIEEENYQIGKVIDYSESSPERYQDDNYFYIENVPLKMNAKYVKVELEVVAQNGFGSNLIQVQIYKNVLTKIRLKRPLAVEGEKNSYAFYVKMPEKIEYMTPLSITITGWAPFEGKVYNLKVTQFIDQDNS